MLDWDRSQGRTGWADRVSERGPLIHVNRSIARIVFT